MSCCPSGQCSATGQCFSKFSRRYARRFRKKGLDGAQQNLLDGIRQHLTGQDHVLEIGCGVGGLHLSLLNEGAASATGVDESAGMIEQARRFADERGLTDRSTYLLGDFVELSAQLPKAEVTVLDKVVCCYEHLDLLIDQSTQKTTRLYGLSHPRESLFVEMSFRIQIFFLRLFRASFRPFWHDWGRMREAILARGFRPVYERPTFLWNVVVFRRV